MRDELDGRLIYLSCTWVVVEESKSKEFSKLYRETRSIKRTLVSISSNKA